MIRPKQNRNRSYYLKQAAERKVSDHIMGKHIRVPRKLPKPQPQALSPIDILIQNLQAAEAEISALIEHCQLEILVAKLLHAPYYKK